MQKNDKREREDRENDLRNMKKNSEEEYKLMKNQTPAEVK